MKKIASKLIFAIVVIGGTILFILGFLAYFKIDKHLDGTIYDGLGRQLDFCPPIISFVFWNSGLWAGWMWFIVDIVFFFGLISIGYLLLQKSKQLKIEN